MSLDMISVKPTDLQELVRKDKDGTLFILFQEVSDISIQIRQVLYLQKDGKIYDFTLNEKFDNYAKDILGRVAMTETIVSMHDTMNILVKENQQ